MNRYNLTFTVNGQKVFTALNFTADQLPKLFQVISEYIAKPETYEVTISLKKRQTVLPSPF